MTGFLLAACSNDHVGEVNGRDIGQAEFTAYLQYKRLPRQNEKVIDNALDQYLEREALADIIEKQSVLDPEQVNVELNEFRKEMLISRYFEKFLKEQINDQSILNYYNQNPQQYQQRKIHVAHILIRTRKNMEETERKAKLTTAQEAYSKIKAGQDFAKIADQYSEDNVSAKKGGDLGWLKEGAISEAFSKRVFDMKKDEVSEPFETPFGFHIVKIIEAPKIVKRPFENVKGDIRYQLRNQAKDAELIRLLSDVNIDKHGFKPEEK